LFAPLAHLSYGWALALWWILSAAIYAICVFAVWRVCPRLHRQETTVLLAAIGFPAFLHLIAWGQTSALALAAFTGAFFLLRGRREFLAGLVFGCLIFKPQLGLAAAVVFLAIGAWRVIGGTILSAGAQLAAGVLYYGVAPFRQWLGVMRNVRTVLPLLEPKPYQTHCLRTFWSMLIPAEGLAFAPYAISAIAVLWWTISIWRRRADAPLALRYSSLLLASVLIAPHLTVYDLVILAPGLLLMADWLVAEWARRSVQILGPLLYLIYMLPLLGPLTRWTHVQLSVIAMAACVYVMGKISRQRASAGCIEAHTHAPV
jgi:alpha-1,2-mannosyltransferase